MQLNPRWIRAGELAVSSMPSQKDIEYIYTTFKTVVILTENQELGYNPKEIEERGVNVIKFPIPDFDAPTLLKLHLLVEEISSCRKPVLIHCSGGLGRSPTVAAAYIMLNKSLSADDVLNRLRKINRRFVETNQQERVLKLYDRLLRFLPRDSLNKILSIAKEYKYNGEGDLEHISNVLELSIELCMQLSELKIASLSDEVETSLYAAAILHDIGRTAGFNHKKESYRLILSRAQEINSALGKDLADKIAVIARYHGKKEVEADNEIKLAIAILRIADGLDRARYYGRIKKVVLELKEGKINIEVHGTNCEAGINKAEEKSSLLREITGMDIKFVNRCKNEL